MNMLHVDINMLHLACRSSGSLYIDSIKVSKDFPLYYKYQILKKYYR